MQFSGIIAGPSPPRGSAHSPSAVSQTMRHAAWQASAGISSSPNDLSYAAIHMPPKKPV